MVATRRGERDGGFTRKTPRVTLLFTVHAALGTLVGGWIICVVGTLHAR